MTINEWTQSSLKVIHHKHRTGRQQPGPEAVLAQQTVRPPFGGGGEHHFDFEGWPAWGSLYGLVSCVAIILVSKLIGKVWLMRREDYYDS